MRCNMTSWSESYSKLERIYKKQIFCCVAFASSKNIKASFFADHKLPWTDLKRLHSQKFKVDITGWVPDEQHIGLWGWESGRVTWRLACRTHRERRCAAEDPDATLPPSLVPPSSPSPPPSSSSSSSPSTVTLILISGLLEKRKGERFSKDAAVHLGRVVTLRFSVLDVCEWSLKETLRTLTGLGGTIRNGIPAKHLSHLFHLLTVLN